MISTFTFTGSVRTDNHEKGLQTNHAGYLFEQEIRDVRVTKVLYVLTMSVTMFFPSNERKQPFEENVMLPQATDNASQHQDMFQIVYTNVKRSSSKIAV